MSFDLQFYKHKDSQTTEEFVAEYLNSNLSFNNSDFPKQWDYENPDTGVYFMIDWNEANSDKEDIQEFDSFNDLINLNFSFSINYYRPNFFGLEAFSVIDKFIQDLDLYTLNLQDHENPIKFQPGELLNSWIKSNDLVSSSKQEGISLEYMPLEKSNYLWWYQFNKTQLEANILEDIYVPNFFILKSKEDGKLYTAVAWTNHIPLILPKVDYIIIQKKFNRFFKIVEESGLVSYDTIINEFNQYFKDYEYEIPFLKILNQENADKIKKKFNRLSIYKGINDFGTGVSKGGFVNIPLS